MSYGLVAFKQDGRPLAYIGHWKAHLALYGLRGRFLAAPAPGLAAYQVSKGTIRFRADEPIPYRLVTKSDRARIAELARGR
jgi:uncharacterized protein YdhG (YjbR/CyaY superfamily)